MTKTLPSIPTASLPRAVVRATCNGSGLITIPTEDGPEHFACLGCRACTPTDRIVISDEQRATRFTEVFSVALDDEPF